ncbi:hypothetical protein IC235_09325 [Hymenobacter sp. BT664]|uniref:Uncharacterized protein n=1 Tax=Hymenobacter montanus TaxID=2771359 RepID=A0A927BDG2_9BACT|nr:hypothetical protein [Hymenobacter montanus]MBD2768089.1 hypothetical protein [Hymenobacter montanus]
MVILLTITQCVSPASKEKIAGVKVPTEWVERVREYDYKQDNLPILKQLEGFIKSDTLAGETDSTHIGRGIVDQSSGGIFTLLFINLDDDPAVELVGIFGYARYDPILAVFKMINNSWYLIYREPFFIFNGESGIQIVNTPSANKTFYMRVLNERGSGVYQDAYRFYKLIHNKIYPCLELTNEARIYGWGLHLNQDVKLRLDFSSTSSDEFRASYAYRFFPGPGYDVSSRNNDQIGADAAFVTGEKSVSYVWDAATYTYQPHPLSYPDMLPEDADLTPDKVACFGQFGNDSLFVKAFAHEIQQTLRMGAKEQKSSLQAYLNFVKSLNRTAVTRDNSLK